MEPVMFDLEALEGLITQGYITKRKHPTQDIWIYNYSAQTQFEQYWTPLTMAARGLILDNNGYVVGRGMPKFLNLEQHTGPLPDGDFEVTDKADGSLGIIYHWAGRWEVATRGSFESDQAKWAQQFLYHKYGGYLDKLDINLSYLVEIVYPQNRIVVDYGDTEELFFLCAVNTEGRDVPVDRTVLPFPSVARYDGIKDISSIKSLGEKNQEGFVIRWVDTDYRLKIKLDDYKRLHKLLTGVTALRVWEVLSNNQDFGTFLEGVPDEFYKWIQGVRAELQEKFDAILTKAHNNFTLIPEGDRKTKAQYIKGTEYPGVLFKMLDQKDPAEMIWKMIRPVGGKAFRCDNADG